MLLPSVVSRPESTRPLAAVPPGMPSLKVTGVVGCGPSVPKSGVNSIGELPAPLRAKPIANLPPPRSSLTPSATSGSLPGVATAANRLKIAVGTSGDIVLVVGVGAAGEALHTGRLVMDDDRRAIHGRAAAERIDEIRVEDAKPAGGGDVLGVAGIGIDLIEDRKARSAGVGAECVDGERLVRPTGVIIGLDRGDLVRQLGDRSRGRPSSLDIAVALELRVRLAVREEDHLVDVGAEDRAGADHRPT